MQTEPFDFDCADGRRVRARLDRPDGQVRAWALFAHCFTCGKDNLAATRISRALAGEGVGTLRLDFAGIGEKGVAAMPHGFTVDVGDLVAAGEYMTSRGCAPGLLVGHSLGGAAAIAAAGDLPSIKAVATVGAPFDVAHVLHLLGPGAETVKPGERHEVCVGGRPVSVGAGFADDLKMQDQKTRLANLKRALLVLHSPVDQIVGIEESAGIFQAARHPKSFVSLDTADHLLSKPADAAYAASVIAAWAARYLDSMEAEAVKAPADGVVRVAETGAGKFQVKVEAGGAMLLADEPVSVGGLASGPTPYELVAAGLGACTVMTLRLYADRKGLALERASVEVRHQKQAGQTPADLFERTLTLEGDLSPEQRERMFEIADKCPVHRTLEAGARVVTRATAAVAAPGETGHFEDMRKACAETGSA
jgi:putative redox protein